jgi:hypothetical protein
VELTRTTSGLVVSHRTYHLRVTADSVWARLEDEDGPWADLCLLANADSAGRPDETYAIAGPDIEESHDRVRLSWRLTSSAWSTKRLTVDCDEAALGFRLELHGDSTLMDVTLLGGQAALPDGRTGSFWSRRAFPTLLPAAPSDPTRVVIPAEWPADSTVSGGGEPGRPGWFFTPAPFWFGATREPTVDPLSPPIGRWMGIGLEAAPDEQRFLGFGYRGGDNGFRCVLDYQGQTHVDGMWTSPTLRLTFGEDQYRLLATYRARLDKDGLLPATTTGTVAPDWWREPMFCGWGAQCSAATADGHSISEAPRYSTQDRYDTWLSHLEAKGVIPGTIVIDDGWAAQYARPQAHPDRWPDLAGWIRERHERGQRVLLWWKAWDAEGLLPGLCVRAPDGAPITVDPNEPEAMRTVNEGIRLMLDPDGLDADGLKIDFTARTPSGATLSHAPGDWGVALLRRLLAGVRETATATRPDALLIGQVPEPSLAPLLDMIRLNDLLRLDDPIPEVSLVPHMRYRAEVVRAAAPNHLVDTDDWCTPSLAAWREYAAVKAEIGVPSLYYADRLDLSGEWLMEQDYALLRRTWSEYRERQGLPVR